MDERVDDFGASESGDKGEIGEIGAPFEVAPAASAVVVIGNGIISKQLGYNVL